MRLLRDLLLRPYVAAAAVALGIVLPLLAVGEASDSEARAQARAQMFAGGSSVAERAVGQIEDYLNGAKQATNAVALGDLRQAIKARDAEGMLTAAGRAYAGTGGITSSRPAIRVTSSPRTSAPTSGRWWPTSASWR